MHSKDKDKEVLLLLRVSDKHFLQFDLIDQRVIDHQLAKEYIQLIRDTKEGREFAILINGVYIEISSANTKFKIIKYNLVSSFGAIFEGKKNSNCDLMEQLDKQLVEVKQRKQRKELKQKLTAEGKICVVHPIQLAKSNEIEPEDEFGPNDEEFKLIPESVMQKIKEGDLIDLAGYRGTGLWYYNGQKFIRTSGEYGYFLPEEAWKMVELYGLEFFGLSDCGAEYVLLPGGDPDKEKIGVYIRPENLPRDEIGPLIFRGKQYRTGIMEFY